MLRLFKNIPLFNKAIRIARIRDFVESPTRMSDPTTFIELIKDYKLHSGYDRLELDDIKLDLVHDHIKKLLDHVYESTDNVGSGISPATGRYRNQYHDNMLKWLRSDKGHYDPEESIERLCEALAAFQEGIEHYYTDYPETAVQRGIGPVSVTLKGLISGLASYRYDMEFLGVSDER